MIRRNAITRIYDLSAFPAPGAHFFNSWFYFSRDIGVVGELD
jgi:hypothetical protein